MDSPIDRGLTATEAYTPSGGYASLRQILLRELSAQRRSILWAAILVVITGCVVITLLAEGYGLPPVWALLFLGGFAAVAERQGVAISERTTMSAGVLPLVFAAVVFGPLGGLIVGAISNTWDLRESRLKWAVYTPIRSLTGAAAGATAWAFVPHPATLGEYLLASLAAAIADLLAENVLVGTTVVVRRMSVRDELLAMGSVSALTIPLYVPLLALLVYSSHVYSLGVVLVLFVPTLAAQRLLHLYQQEKEATSRLAAANARLRSANKDFMRGLVGIYEEEDPYTAGHSLVVAKYARDIAERIGLSEEECDLAEACGLVHDIGKCKTELRDIVKKPGSLTPEEHRLMQMHPEWGAELVRKIEIEDYGRIGKIVRHHHEWIDGNGYPDGLSDTEIPLLSKIISVADAYNAMTSHRSYRDAMPSQVARIQLAQGVGTQFDTTVVAAFEAILASSDEDYRTGRGPRFDFHWNEADAEEGADVVPLRAVS